MMDEVFLFFFCHFQRNCLRRWFEPTHCEYYHHKFIVKINYQIYSWIIGKTVS